ncbi:hypothetical protein BBU94A_I09 (plasmid) [Borreliella burgdorferi 94a]|nr:hypothetical protein BBU94A_I09 [Borreliella burgdorferi 94a]
MAIAEFFILPIASFRVVNILLCSFLFLSLSSSHTLSKYVSTLCISVFMHFLASILSSLLEFFKYTFINEF